MLCYQTTIKTSILNTQNLQKKEVVLSVEVFFLNPARKTIIVGSLITQSLTIFFCTWMVFHNISFSILILCF